MKYIQTSLLFLLIMTGSCEKIAMEPNPNTDAVSIFDEYSKLIEEKHAMLDFQNIDFETLKNDLRATITNKTNDKELFNILGELTENLRDGHSSLHETSEGQTESTMSVWFDFNEGYEAGFDEGVFSYSYHPYLESSLEYILDYKGIIGTLPEDPDIGYLGIYSWLIEISDEEIENIFIKLKDTKGLVLDLRGNTGGDPILSTKFASYFTDQTIYVGYERFKTGPNATDFSSSKSYLRPASSENKYLKPVMVLTDRNVYSASTTFLYNVDPIERIKTVGQRSGGGSGSISDGYLANGWYWVLSTSEFIDAKERHINDGVDPDIPVTLNLEDITKDEVIERAIIELEGL